MDAVDEQNIAKTEALLDELGVFIERFEIRRESIERRRLSDPKSKELLAERDECDRQLRELREARAHLLDRDTHVRAKIEERERERQRQAEGES